MRALVIEKPGQFAIETVPDPMPGPGEVVVQTFRSGAGREIQIRPAAWGH
jgi:hypothetical protein